jgi:hypothetical protein
VDEILEAGRVMRRHHCQGSTLLLPDIQAGLLVPSACENESLMDSAKASSQLSGSGDVFG